MQKKLSKAFSNNNKFMAEAIKLALDGVRQKKGGPFGAVVVKDGAIISRGQNCVTATADPTAHAEIVAIRAACRKLNSFQLDGCEIYSSCEPCPMCLGAIYWARPARFYYAANRQDAAAYGFDDEFIYREMEKQPAGRKIPMIHLAPANFLEPFLAWHKLADKIAY